MRQNNFYPLKLIGILSNFYKLYSRLSLKSNENFALIFMQNSGINRLQSKSEIDGVPIRLEIP